MGKFLFRLWMVFCFIFWPLFGIAMITYEYMVEIIRLKPSVNYPEIKRMYKRIYTAFKKGAN